VRVLSALVVLRTLGGGRQGGAAQAGAAGGAGGHSAAAGGGQLPQLRLALDVLQVNPDARSRLPAAH
jgi:hypothetical protein